MSLDALLAAGRIRAHTTSKAELDALRALVERDFLDAAIPSLSADRRFATAYNAVLQLSKMALACAGYRVPADAVGALRRLARGRNRLIPVSRYSHA